MTDTCSLCGKQVSVGDMLLDTELRYNCRKCVMNHLSYYEVVWLKERDRKRRMGRLLDPAKIDFKPFNLQFDNKKAKFAHDSTDDSTDNKSAKQRLLHGNP